MKIREQLIDAAELKQKSSEDDAAFLERVIAAIGKVSDETWEGLSSEAQNWYNDATDALNANKELPAFDDEKKEEPKATGRRTSTKTDKDDAGAAEPKKGDSVKLVTKKGREFVGTLLKINDDEVVIDTEDGEEEFDRDRVESITPVKSESKAKSGGGSEPEGYEPRTGDVVTLVKTNDDEYEGKIVEFDDEDMTLEVDGKEKTFSRNKIKSLIPAKSAKEEPKATGRRTSTKTDKDDAGDDKGGTQTRRVSKDANGGVSPSERAREIIVEDDDLTLEQVIKQLTKEKLEFKENTITLVYKEVHKVIDLLKKAKRLK